MSNDERASDPRLAADDLVGSITFFAGPDHVPRGWLACDGKSYLRREYPRLYAVIGDRYGTGDPANATFKVPNMKGLVPVGVGSDSPDLNKKIGETVGALKATGDFSTSGASGSSRMHGSRQGNLEAGDPFNYTEPGHTHAVTVDLPTIQPGIILRALIKAQ